MTADCCAVVCRLRSVNARLPVVTSLCIGNTPTARLLKAVELKANRLLSNIRVLKLLIWRILRLNYISTGLYAVRFLWIILSNVRVAVNVIRPPLLQYRPSYNCCVSDVTQIVWHIRVTRIGSLYTIPLYTNRVHCPRTWAFFYNFWSRAVFRGSLDRNPWTRAWKTTVSVNSEPNWWNMFILCH